MVWHLSDLPTLFLFNQKEKNSHRLLIKKFVRKKKKTKLSPKFLQKKRKGRTMRVTFSKPKLIKPCNQVTTVKSYHFNHFRGSKLPSFFYKNK